MAEILKPVSCYMNDTIKLALEKEAIQFKGVDPTGNRTTMNKNCIFIFEQFIKKYSKNTKKMEKLIEKTFSLKMGEFTGREFNKILDVKLLKYPLKLSIDCQEKLNSIRLECNKSLGFNLKKTNFYNLILLSYYIENRVSIAQKEIDFWSQEHLEKGKPASFNEVVELFEKMVRS